MKTVLLLGAGASVAEAKAQGISKEEWPPTDTTFFKYCIKQLKPRFQQISDYAKNLLGLDLEAEHLSSELVFNKAYTLAVQENSVVGAALAQLYYLIDLYQKAIADSTDKINCNSAGGVFSLVEWLTSETNRENIQLITFNYDLVVEKALSNLKRESYVNPIFEFNTAYLIDPYQTLPPSPNSDGEGFPTSMFGNSISVIKLHGSLNWLRGVEGNFDKLDPIGKIPYKLFLYQGKKIFVKFILDLENPNRTHTTKFAMHPLIVPPVYKKTQFYSNLFKPLWRRAEESIELAERLIIFGYSLPEADTKAQNMLARALAKNSRTPDVHIIDTDPTVCDKFRRKLKIVSLKYYQDVDEFISQNQN